MALTCGLRRGEILALRWTDLDLGRTPTLRVRRTLQRVGGELTFSDPKSLKSRRTLVLPNRAVVALRRHRTQQAAERLRSVEWDDHGLVFATADGKPIDPRNLLRTWHRILDRVDLSKRPLHEARHAAASLMLSSGVPLKSVQEALGHSTMRLTGDLYGHLMPGDMERVATAIDKALRA